MVHVVKKKIGNHHYLYLQRSFKEDGKGKTAHVAYLGRADEVTQREIDKAIGYYNKREKDENRRAKRQAVGCEHRPKSDIRPDERERDVGKKDKDNSCC